MSKEKKKVVKPKEPKSTEYADYGDYLKLKNKNKKLR